MNEPRALLIWLGTAGLQSIALILFTYWGVLNQFNAFYYISCLVALLLLMYQQWLIRHRDPKLCFQAFLNNQWVGAVLFIGTACQI